MSVNISVISGFVPKDPAYAYASNGKAMCRFSVGVDISYGKNKEITFIPVVAFDKLAEISVAYIKRGTKVLVSGKIKHSIYEDKSGNKHYSMNIIVSQIQILSNGIQNTYKRKTMADIGGVPNGVPLGVKQEEKEQNIPEINFISEDMDEE